jgi:hypothetical protein
MLERQGHRHWRQRVSNVVNYETIGLKFASFVNNAQALLEPSSRPLTAVRLRESPSSSCAVVLAAEEVHESGEDL